MDEFKFFCPSCNQKLSAPMDMVGHEIDCPICEAVITIPAPAAPAPVAPAPVPQPAPADTTAGDDPFSTTMRLDFKELGDPEPPAPAAPLVPPSPVPQAPVPQPPTLTPQPSPSSAAFDGDLCNGCRNPLVVDALGTCVFCGLNYKSGIRIAGA